MSVWAVNERIEEYEKERDAAESEKNLREERHLDKGVHGARRRRPRL